MNALRALTARLRGDARGLALVEFAMVLPVTLTLYMGGYQISDAIACNRKVTITARSVADLTSQYSILTASDVDDILDAAAKVLSPYDVANAVVRVSQITTDANNNTTVAWSRAQNGTPLTKGSAFTPTVPLKSSGVTLIYAEVYYTYRPIAGFGFVGNKTLSQTVFMMPRMSDTVQCSDCSS